MSKLLKNKIAIYRNCTMPFIKKNASALQSQGVHFIIVVFN